MSVEISVLGGSWNVGTAWTGAVAPTAADDVTATALSGNLTTAGTDVCRSLDFTNYVGTFTHNAVRSMTLSIGDGTAGAGNVAIKLVAGMTFTNNTVTTLKSTSTTQQTITSVGKSIGAITINGAGSSYLLADDLILTATGIPAFILTSGNFDTGNKNITITGTGQFGPAATATSLLTLGTSTITISSTAAWNFSNTSNLTFSGASSTVSFTYTGASANDFQGGGLTYGALQITVGGSGILTVSGSNSFNNIVRASTGTKTINFTDGTTTTLRGGASSFLSGTSGNLITITGTATAGWNLSSAVNLSSDYLAIDYCTVVGGGILYCGVNSTDGGHNDAATVKFTAPPAVPPSVAFMHYSGMRR